VPLAFDFLDINSSFYGTVVKYKNPPVVETVLSVQFNPLANFGAGQLGSYWKELGTGWPYVADAPAVDPVFERFESTTAWEAAAFGVKFTTQIDVRLQIRNTAKDRMIQVQNGRFIYNWLGAADGNYPSYESVRPEFDEHWNNFRKFVVSNSDEDVVQPNQWEVIYVNRMPRGTVWRQLPDLQEVLTFLKQPPLSDSGLSFRSIGGEWQYEIPPRKGTFYLKLGMEQKDSTPNVVMTLLARGPIGEEVSSLDEGLELGHTTITKAFDRLTSNFAQKYWGIKNVNA